jgi:eukaryotic-like serine/threonine-protein kinase
MPLGRGSRLDVYEIVHPLGSGGMGEVWLATELRLGRKVALKLLPADLTRDPARVHRFEQEARAASALSHPNVCHIYALGETNESQHYIAMEYVEGETLRQRLSGTRVSIREALDIAIQVAAALSAAHGAGIVHRDIKPENVMLRPDGIVKVLDFGLAKLAPMAPRIVGGETTQTVLRTEAGMVVGTAAYMSPEQARGHEVDTRTDIWSLGVLLYEMVAGRSPFAATSGTDVLAAILDREPAALARFEPDAPQELQRIVTKALRKERAQRYQTVQDLLLDLQALRDDLRAHAHVGSAPITTITTEPAASGSSRTVAPVPPRSRRVWLAAAVIAGAGAMGVGWWVKGRTPEGVVPVGPMRTVPLTTLPGLERSPSFSPDGNQIAFSWDGDNGNEDIYVKLIGAGSPLRLTTSSAPDVHPAWSPDGLSIAFVRISDDDGGIFIISALGGPERRIGPLKWEVEWDPYGAGLSWSPDGRYLAFSDRSAPEAPVSLFVMSLDQSVRRKLTSPPALSIGDLAPEISRDGHSVAFIHVTSSGVSDIYRVPVAGGEPTRLTTGESWLGGVAWTPDDTALVFASGGGLGGSLWSVPAAGGKPERLPIGGDNASEPTTSRRENRLAFVQQTSAGDIWQLDVPRRGQQISPPTRLIASTRHEAGPHFSPDGKRIAFHSDRSGSMEIWVCDAAGHNLLQWTSIGGRLTGTPRWAPDSRHVAFDSRAGDNSDIYVMLEGGPPRRITSEGSDDVVPSWSTDGQSIYFASNRTGRWEVWKTGKEGGSAGQVTRHGGFAAFESSDGRTVYYAKGQRVAGLWSVPVKGGDETLVMELPEAGYWGYWALFDQGIYFVDTSATPHVINFLDLGTRRITRIAALARPVVALYAPGLTVSPDGRKILYVQEGHLNSDLVLVEKFPFSSLPAAR